MAQCKATPDLSLMRENFERYLKTLYSNNKEAVVFMPFYDNAAGLADPALSQGLPMFLYDRFSSANGNLAHPYIGFWAVQKLAVSGADLFKPENAAKVAAATKARYVVFGAYQRDLKDDNLRVHINIYDTKTKQPLSPAVDVTSRYDDAIFDLLSVGAVTAFNQAKISLSDKTKTLRLPTLTAFNAYAKATALANNYNPTTLAQATLWYEKALKESFEKSDDAALGLARVYYMQALIKKLYQQDYSQLVTRARETLKYLEFNDAEAPKYKLIARFDKAHNFGLQAASALTAGNGASAKGSAKQGLAELPEDGMMQTLYHMAGGGADKGVVLNDLVCVN